MGSVRQKVEGTLSEQAHITSTHLIFQASEVLRTRVLKSSQSTSSHGAQPAFALPYAQHALQPCSVPQHEPTSKTSPEKFHGHVYSLPFSPPASSHHFKPRFAQGRLSKKEALSTSELPRRIQYGLGRSSPKLT